MSRSTRYVPANDQQEITLPQPQEMLTAAQTASGVYGANFFKAKMTLPGYELIIFRGSQGQYEVESDWNGIWTPMSIMLINPWSFPIYVAAASDDPLSTGIPFPPETSLRVPLAGQRGSLILAVQEADLAGNDAIVHLFRYATPD